MKTAPISVELIDSMGSDLTVVNAARVSFSKESEWYWKTPGGAEVPDHDIENHSRLAPCGYVQTLSSKDKKLIKYLAAHGHWSPFAHTALSFRIKAPIFVARQLVKHQVGLVWNEVSRRYVDDEPEFFIPILRKRAENVKQGSRDEFPANLDKCDAMIDNITRGCLLYYNALLKEGVAPEQARMVLPLNTMTEWIWSGSLMAFARVYGLRTDSHAQKECRDVAYKIGNEARELFPHSFEALTTPHIKVT